MKLNKNKMKKILFLIFLLGIYFPKTILSQPQIFAKKQIALILTENLTEKDGLENDFHNQLQQFLKNNSNYSFIEEKSWEKILKENKLEKLNDFFSILESDDLAKIGKLISADVIFLVSIYTYREEANKKFSKVLIELSANFINIEKNKFLETTESYLGEIPKKKKIKEARELALSKIIENLFFKLNNFLEPQKQKVKEEKSTQQLPVIGNFQSKFYHLPNVEHLPESKYLKNFNSEKEAKKEGFKPCPICFPQKKNSTLAITSIEESLGQEASGLIEYLYRVKNNEKQLKKINKIAKKIIMQTPRHKLRFIFRILDTDEINAFASPNGNIYITQGLLDIVETEGELAGVIAHEISHIVKKHSVSQYNRSTKLAILGAVVTGGQTNLATEFALSLILNGYDRKFEREADKLGVIYLIKASYLPDDFILMLKKLQDTEKYAPSKLEVYFQTHPSTKERIKNIQEFLKNKEELLSQLDKLVLKN